MIKMTPWVAVARTHTPRGRASIACPSALENRLAGTRVPTVVFDPRTGDAMGGCAWSPPV